MDEKDRKATILVIEDDLDVLSVFIKHLNYSGYNVITAQDGMEGLKMIESGGYDLVITDIVMPYVSGIGMVSALKERNPEIPVIAITGYGKEPKNAILEKKPDLILAKPIKMSILTEHINNLLKKG